MIKIYLKFKLDFTYNADELLSNLTDSLLNLKIIQTSVIYYIENIKLLGYKHDNFISKDCSEISGRMDIKITPESLIKDVSLIIENLNFIIKNVDLVFTYQILTDDTLPR